MIVGFLVPIRDKQARIGRLESRAMLDKSEIINATRLLNLLGQGNLQAGEELGPLLWRELHIIASHALRQRAGSDTIAPTELVNEAWLRFAGKQANYASRHHFLALAAHVMRSVLVDHARARNAQKRGGGQSPITLSGDVQDVQQALLDVLDLDEVMQRLERLDPELHRLVELRFFAGLTHPEIAAVTGTQLRTVERRWQLARAWLSRELSA